MGSLNGVHHLAICTNDVKAQIAFFNEVLGAELRALYWMHGAEKTFHAFVRLNDTCYIAFVQKAGDALPDAVPGVSHADNYASMSAAGTTQHIAFNVDDDAGLLALRDRIRLHGHNVFGPIDHGFCHSIYFAGPDGLLLEAATSSRPIDASAWIDPEVVALAGISHADLQRYLHPLPNEDHGGSVPQPPIDPGKPRMRMSQREYEWLMTAPDDEVIRRLSEPAPPAGA